MFVNQTFKQCFTVLQLNILGWELTKPKCNTGTGTDNCDINLQVNYLFVYVLYTLNSSNM